MEVTFSSKYQPLFKLLEAWNVTKSPTFKKGHTKAEQKEWLEYASVHTVNMSGGRDSGKSFGKSTFEVLASKDYGHRVLSTRQTMSSTDNSITKGFDERMTLLNCLGDFNFANNQYTTKGEDEKGLITITGQKTSKGTETAKLKSIENYSIFSTDEGEELESFEDWNKIKRSLRSKDVQTIALISFNPPTKEHWLYEQFYEGLEEGFNGIKNGVLYIHTTYLDNGRENMTETNWNEYESLRLAYEEYEKLSSAERESAPKKLKKKRDSYKFEILGGFKDVAEGVIYEDWALGDFPENLPLTCYGLDFGSNDYDALTKVAVDRKNMKIYIKEMYFMNNKGAGWLMRSLSEIVGTKDLIIADSAERRMIRDFYDGMSGDDRKYYRGLNIRKVRKSKGAKLNFVARRIKTCQSYTLIIDPGSTNLIKAVKNYVWHDSRAGVPKHDYSDLMDSFGYAAIDLIWD